MKKHRLSWPRLPRAHPPLSGFIVGPGILHRFRENTRFDLSRFLNPEGFQCEKLFERHVHKSSLLLQLNYLCPQRRFWDLSQQKQCPSKTKDPNAAFGKSITTSLCISLLFKVTSQRWMDKSHTGLCKETTRNKLRAVQRNSAKVWWFPSGRNTH